MARFASKKICEGWVIEHYTEHHRTYILTVPPGENIASIKETLSTVPGGSRRFITNETFDGIEIYFRADESMTLRTMMNWVIENFNLEYNQPERKVSKGRYKRRIHQYTPDGTYLTTWESIKEAATTLGLSSSGICSALRGNQDYAGGFIWKYAE